MPTEVGLKYDFDGNTYSIPQAIPNDMMDVFMSYDNTPRSQDQRVLAMSEF